jgi:hypothetical protein
VKQRVRAERSRRLIVAAELNRRGLDVYLPVADDPWIDMVIRVNGPTVPRHFDIRVVSVASRSRVIGVRLPEQRKDEFILVIHYRRDDRSDDLLYLTGDQAEQHRDVESGWGDLLIDRATCKRYAHQTLGALAEFLISQGAPPSAREIQRQALSYVCDQLGAAIRVGQAEWTDDEWVVDLWAPDEETHLGRLHLNKWGEILTEKSATYDSVRRTHDAASTQVSAA